MGRHRHLRISPRAARSARAAEHRRASIPPRSPPGEPAGPLSFPSPTSWADRRARHQRLAGQPDAAGGARAPLPAWAGGSASAGDPLLLESWRRLGTSDHCYYMCTKAFARRRRAPVLQSPRLAVRCVRGIHERADRPRAPVRSRTEPAGAAHGGDGRGRLAAGDLGPYIRRSVATPLKTEALAMLKEFKEFAMRGNVARPRRRHHHRRRVRHDRQVAGRRRHHAADRTGARQRRLLRPVPAPQGRRQGRAALCHAGRGPGGGRGDHQLRPVRQQRHHLPYRRLRGVPAGQGRTGCSHRPRPRLRRPRTARTAGWRFRSAPPAARTALQSCGRIEGIEMAAGAALHSKVICARQG